MHLSVNLEGDTAWVKFVRTRPLDGEQELHIASGIASHRALGAFKSVTRRRTSVIPYIRNLYVKLIR